MKKILHWSGSILSIAGVIFVAIKLSEYGAQFGFSWLTFGSLLALFGLAIIFASANIFLALAWKALLRHLGIDVNFAWAIRTYGVSQLAKYVPGNIFHLAGRQAIGQAAGLPAWPLAKSAVWELSLISVTGAMFGILVLPHFASVVSTHLAVVAFVCILVIMVAGLKKYVGQQVALAVGWYAAFLAVSGLIFTVLLTLLIAKNTIPPIQAISISSAFVVAWLAGMVTPGAPAGIGVRELVLLVLLKGIVTETDLLLAVLLSRSVAVVGDFLFYLVALVVPSGLTPVNPDHQ